MLVVERSGLRSRRWEDLLHVPRVELEVDVERSLDDDRQLSREHSASPCCRFIRNLCAHTANNTWLSLNIYSCVACVKGHEPTVITVFFCPAVGKYT